MSESEAYTVVREFLVSNTKKLIEEDQVQTIEDIEESLEDLIKITRNQTYMRVIFDGHDGRIRIDKILQKFLEDMNPVSALYHRVICLPPDPKIPSKPLSFIKKRTKVADVKTKMYKPLLLMAFKNQQEIKLVTKDDDISRIVNQLSIPQREEMNEVGPQISNYCDLVSLTEGVMCADPAKRLFQRNITSTYVKDPEDTLRTFKLTASENPFIDQSGICYSECQSPYMKYLGRVGLEKLCFAQFIMNYELYQKKHNVSQLMLSNANA